MVEPVHPLQGGDLHVGSTTLVTQVMNDFRLVEPDDGLSQGVVIAVAATADRGGGPSLGEPFRVANRQVLRAAVAMNDQPPAPFPGVQRLLQGVQDRKST